MKYCAAILLLLCIAVSGKGQTLSQKLTAGSWKVTDLSLDNNGDGTPDVKLWKPCRTGSTYTFNANGSGTYYKGPQPCNPQDAATSTFTWTASDAGSISINTAGANETVSVVMSDPQHVVLWFTKSKVRFVLERL